VTVLAVTCAYLCCMSKNSLFSKQACSWSMVSRKVNTKARSIWITCNIFPIFILNIYIFSTLFLFVIKTTVDPVNQLSHIKKVLPKCFLGQKSKRNDLISACKWQWNDIGKKRLLTEKLNLSRKKHLGSSMTQTDASLSIYHCLNCS